jgi:tetratricopeptide (TPR) repeat protein
MSPRGRRLRLAPPLVLAALAAPAAVSCSGGTPTAPGPVAAPPAPADPAAARLDREIAEATAAIGKDPNAVNDRGELAHARRGRAYAEKGDHDKAIADYTEAVRLYPVVRPPYARARLIEAYNARAECHRKKGDLDRAIADYTEVIGIGTGAFADLGEVLAFGGFAATAHYKRGVCHDDKGDHARAMADYQEAIRLGPDLKNNDDLKRRMSK